MSGQAAYPGKGFLSGISCFFDEKCLPAADHKGGCFLYNPVG